MLCYKIFKRGSKHVNFIKHSNLQQIKFLYKLITSANAHWNRISQYWIQKYDIEYHESLFLCKCYSFKGLTLSEKAEFFYQKCISRDILGLVHRQAKIQSNEHILNEFFFGNMDISVRNNQFFFRLQQTKY